MGSRLRSLCLALVPLCGLLSGCAGLRDALVGAAADAAQGVVHVVFQRGDTYARRRFDEKYRPITGKGFADYDVNGDGALDAEEVAEATADLGEVAYRRGEEGRPLTAKEIAALLGSLGTVAGTGWLASKSGDKATLQRVLEMARASGSRLAGGAPPEPPLPTPSAKKAVAESA